VEPSWPRGQNRNRVRPRDGLSTKTAAASRQSGPESEDLSLDSPVQSVFRRYNLSTVGNGHIFHLEAIAVDIIGFNEEFRRQARTRSNET